MFQNSSGPLLLPETPPSIRSFKVSSSQKVTASSGVSGGFDTGLEVDVEPGSKEEGELAVQFRKLTKHIDSWMEHHEILIKTLRSGMPGLLPLDAAVSATVTATPGARILYPQSSLLSSSTCEIAREKSVHLQAQRAASARDSIRNDPDIILYGKSLASRGSLNASRLSRFSQGQNSPKAINNSPYPSAETPMFDFMHSDVDGSEKKSYGSVGEARRRSKPQRIFLTTSKSFSHTTSSHECPSEGSTQDDFQWPNDIIRSRVTVQNRLTSIVSDDDRERKSQALAESMRKNRSIKTRSTGSDSSPRKGFRRTSVKLHNLLHDMVKGRKFLALIGCLILSNAAFVGVEVEWMANAPSKDTRDTPAALLAIGYAYSAAFLAELILRLFADGLKFFYEEGFLWNYLDFFLVLVSIGEVVLDIVNAARESQNASNAKLMRLIRIARLVRVVRVVRVIRFVLALRTLVHSIMSTLKSLLWAMLLLTMIIYVFGIVFTQAATTYFEDNYDAAAHLYWSSLGKSLFTLFKCVSGGLSWHDAITPLGQMHPVYVLFFLTFVTFTYFAVLNVVTGVFCQSAVESAHHDYELVIQSQLRHRQMYETKIKKLFADIDQLGTGEVTIEDFERFLESPNMQAYFASLELDTDDAWTLFKLLDVDTTHMLDMEEFLQGCLRLRGPAKAIDLAKIQYENRILQHKLTEFVVFTEASLSVLLKDRGIDLNAIASQQA